LSNRATGDPLPQKTAAAVDEFGSGGKGMEKQGSRSKDEFTQLGVSIAPIIGRHFFGLEVGEADR